MKYKIYAPNGEEYVFYFGEVDNDEYLPLFPWDYEDRILDNDKLEFYNLENNTIKLIYYQDDQQFVLEDINKNKIYFKKSIATKNSRINYLKVEYIEYNNGKSIEFDYEETTSIKISQIVTNDGKIYIDYFANGLIKKVSNSENSNNINFDYEEYEITTNNYVYRIKNITVNETLMSGELYESDIITFSYKNTSDFPNLIDKISDIRSRENIKYHYNNQGKIIKVDFYLENSNFFNTSIEFEKESNNTKVITNNNYIYYVFDNYGCVLYQMDNNGKIMSYQYDKTLPQYDTNKKLISKNSINAYSRNLIYDNFIYDYETFFNNDSLKGWKKVICENYIVTNNQIIKEGQYSVLMNQESEIERVVIGDFNNELSLSFNYKTIGNFINAYCKISLDNGKTYQINLKNSGGNWDKAIINGIEAENAISIRINIYFNGYNLYLDNIQLGNNVSTHTNLMHNGFFEFGSETYQNSFWNFEDNSENALIVTCENDNLHPNATLGSKVLSLNNATTSSTIADTKINITGKKGDIFTFSALVKQISNYSSDEVKIELCFNHNTPVEILKTNPYTNNWQPITKVFTEDEDYDCINIRLINNTSSQVYFDGIQIIKDEVGEYYEYDDNNRIIKVNSRNTIAFEYDGFGHLLGVQDGEGNGNNYLYNNEGKLIESMDYSLKGLMYFYDENGNIIRNIDQYVNDKILSAYEYNETNNFLLSKEFNERGQEKQYYYHLNNYLQQERYISSNKIINYEYNNLNNLSSLNVIDSEDSERIYYTYNNTNKKDQLTGILNPGLNYVNYNENYNTGILSVAFQEVGATTSLLNFVSMSYSNEGLLISKKYGISGTIYNFEYNNSNNLSNVKVNNSIKYHYSYDSLGNVVGIDDYVNNNRTQLSYDDKNNLTNYDDEYISVKYYYDKTNTINKSTLAQFDSIRSYEYYFNKDYNINNFE